MNKQLLQALVQARAVSGDEAEVRKILSAEYHQRGLTVQENSLGAIWAKKSGIINKRRVLVLAHQDEVGFVITNYQKNGLLSFQVRGGINKDVLAGSLVQCRVGNNKFTGVISNIPPHLKDIGEQQHAIDCGFKDEEEAKKIPLGTTFTFTGDLHFQSGKVIGKALDDRIGCLMGVDLLDQLKEVDLPFDLFIGASVQEEVGLRSAETIARAVKPDLAIILDCSPAGDCYRDQEQFGKLGEGLLIRFFDPSMLPWATFIDYQIACAEATNSKYQYFLSYGATDAGAFHKALDGIPTLTHCIAARYIHSPAAIVDEQDYQAALRTLQKMITDLDEEKIAAIIAERTGV